MGGEAATLIRSFRPADSVWDSVSRRGGFAFLYLRYEFGRARQCAPKRTNRRATNMCTARVSATMCQRTCVRDDGRHRARRLTEFLSRARARALQWSRHLSAVFTHFKYSGKFVCTTGF